MRAPDSGTGAHPGESERVAYRLLVAPIPFDMSEADLCQVLGTLGPIKRAWFARDRATGRRRAHGYVEVESPRLAQALVEHFNGKLITGHSFSLAPIIG